MLEAEIAHEIFALTCGLGSAFMGEVAMADLTEALPRVGQERASPLATVADGAHALKDLWRRRAGRLRQKGADLRALKPRMLELATAFAAMPVR